MTLLADLAGWSLLAFGALLFAETAERFAFEFRIPTEIFWLLIALTVLGMAALGYQLALRGPRIRGLAALLTLIWTVVIVDIFDLASPRLGGFRTSLAAYEWTLQSMHGRFEIPALRAR